MYKPEKSEYDPYYQRYISLVQNDNIKDVLAEQTAELNSLISSLPEEKGIHTYDEGKWTIKEVISHLIDGERIFAYRVFRIARADKTPIEGFEQDGYIENSHANGRSFAELLDEFGLLRRANVLFFNNLKSDDWLRIGTANQAEISVRAIAFIMAGHITHHLNILKERYLA